MDLYERKLMHEVLYLHSLWHQGPPRNQNPSSIVHHPNVSTNQYFRGRGAFQFAARAVGSGLMRQPSPAREPVPGSSRNLSVSNTKPFKKPNENKGKKKKESTKKKKKKKESTKKKKKKKSHQPAPSPDSDNEWPQPVYQSPPPSLEWPKVDSASGSRTISAEERAEIVARKLQTAQFGACRAFFRRNTGSDSDVEEDEDEDGDFWVDKSNIAECDEYKFFLRMFTDNSELRDYYEKNSETGEFFCLVCGGMGKKKADRKYKGCAALALHSTTTSNMKKRAHTAFGRVICTVLGWDFDRLPAIVSKGVPLSQSLLNSDKEEPTLLPVQTV